MKNEIYIFEWYFNRTFRLTIFNLIYVFFHPDVQIDIFNGQESKKINKIEMLKYFFRISKPFKR